jgi:hypothetical protein
MRRVRSRSGGEADDLNSPAQVQAPGLRSKLRLWALFCDVALAAGSYKLVLMVFASLHYARFQSG